MVYNSIYRKFWSGQHGSRVTEGRSGVAWAGERD